MKNLLSGAALCVFALVGGSAAMGQVVAGDLPPDALPGHCYGKMLVPEEYESYTEQVIDTAARTETHIIPAVTTQQDQQVVETEAHVEYLTVPATYRTITETITIRPAVTRTETVPAVYGTETEQVIVREAHTVWKRGAAGPGEVQVPGQTKLLATGEVLCLVQVPAEYRTITHQVVKIAESTRQVVEPAVTETVTRQVIDQPARVVERQIPATYKTIRITVVTQPERAETVTIPAVYKTITKQRLVSQSRFEWREVRCQPEAGGAPPIVGGTELAPPTLAPPRTAYRETHTETFRSSATLVETGDGTTRHLQEALKRRGYYEGPVTGRFTSSTQQAMLRFQRDNGLTRGSFSSETARALGIDAPVAAERGERG